jgi:hypothetical protein
MSDDAIKTTKLSQRQERGASSSRAFRYAICGIGALIVLLTIAYIDGGEEPLHPIVQSVSLPPQAEGGQ